MSTMLTNNLHKIFKTTRPALSENSMRSQTHKINKPVINTLHIIACGKSNKVP